MPLVKEDGTGLANANTYANVADGDKQSWLSLLSAFYPAVSPHSSDQDHDHPYEKNNCQRGVFVTHPKAATRTPKQRGRHYGHDENPEKLYPFHRSLVTHPASERLFRKLYRSSIPNLLHSLLNLMLIKEDGTGLANANTYANVADTDAYYLTAIPPQKSNGQSEHGTYQQQNCRQHMFSLHEQNSSL